MAAVKGWFPVIQGGSQGCSGAPGRRPPTERHCLCPGHIITILHPGLFTEFFTRVLHKRGYMTPSVPGSSRVVKLCFTLFTGTKVFVWLRSRSVAGEVSVVDYARRWLGAGNGDGLAGSVRRTRAVKPADSAGDQITQNPKPEFPHIRSSLQSLKETLAKVTFKG